MATDAYQFVLALGAATEVHQSIGMPIEGVVSSNHERSYTWWPGDGDNGLSRREEMWVALRPLVDDLTNGVPVRCQAETVMVPGGTFLSELQPSARDNDARLFLHFPDGSTLALAGKDEDERTALDDGPALLDPITLGEFRAVEGVLAVLRDAISSGDLTDRQEALIRAMFDLVRSEHLDTVPDVTKRHHLVGVVGGALKYTAKEVPKDALAWWKLIELLQKIDWHTIAGSLPG